jgi:hypothetical protein
MDGIYDRVVPMCGTGQIIKMSALLEQMTTSRQDIHTT